MTLDADRAAAEKRGAEQALAPFDALFNGGPDTSCRTTWREVPGITDGQRNRMECVEVPMADLRAAFDQAEEVASGDTGR